MHTCADYQPGDADPDRTKLPGDDNQARTQRRVRNDHNNGQDARMHIHTEATRGNTNQPRGEGGDNKNRHKGQARSRRGGRTKTGHRNQDAAAVNQRRN